MNIHIGCSGWYYDHWIGCFYPDSLKKQDWLPYYAQHFSCLEINLTRFCLYLSSLGQRCAFEFRDASWLNNDVAGLLQATGFGYVTADYPDFYLRRHVPRTGSFYYLRLHGRSGDYASSYSKAQLQAIAKAIAAYRADETCEDCFIMFNNDYGGNAVHNARTLLALCNT